MPIVGQDQPTVVYRPPNGGNTSYRNSRVSPPDPPRGHVSVYSDQETDVELLLAIDGQSLTIRVGTDRLELSGREWRGLYSGVLNVGPGRDVAP